MRRATGYRLAFLALAAAMLTVACTSDREPARTSGFYAEVSVEGRALARRPARPLRRRRPPERDPLVVPARPSSLAPGGRDRRHRHRRRRARDGRRRRRRVGVRRPREHLPARRRPLRRFRRRGDAGPGLRRAGGAGPRGDGRRAHLAVARAWRRPRGRPRRRGDAARPPHADRRAPRPRGAASRGRSWTPSACSSCGGPSTPSGGGQSYHAEVTALDYGTEIDAERFTFWPPAGAREADAGAAGSCRSTSGPLGRASFPARPGFLQPAYAPPGYRIAGTGGASSASSCEQVAVWALLESEEGGAILLRQRLRPGGMPSLDASWQPVAASVHEAYRHSGSHVLSLLWRDGDVVALLQADTAPLEELLRIAESARLVP